MDLLCAFKKIHTYAMAAAFVAVAGMTMPVYAQQGASKGIVNDWSNHHIIFSNPGTEAHALLHGTYQQWQSAINNPRYRAQQVMRSAAWANRFAPAESAISRVSGIGRPNSFTSKKPPLHRDWAVQIVPPGSPAESGLLSAATTSSAASVVNSGIAPDISPALYGADFTKANCADFVVFPVSAAGALGTTTGQANIVGFNNLYDTTCPGTVPDVEFSYYVGSGSVLTSPVLSLNGTQVAFVESANGIGLRTNFHVLTIGNSGDNGSAYDLPAVPYTIVNNGKTVNTVATNNAVDRFVTLKGNPSVTRSSPFVDYAANVAYVGDDNGSLHKFTGVFGGALAEVTTGGWPFTVARGAILTGPVFDSTSGHVFVGASDGNVYCVVGGTAAACGTPSISVANGSVSSGPVLDPPIVDSTSERLFSEAVATTNSGTESILMQTNVNLAQDVVRVNMGGGAPVLHNGTFDNAYYTSPSDKYTGYMYFCGNSTATLYRVGFIHSGKMNSTADHSSYRLVANGDTSNTCSPLTEVSNGTKDYLFLGVSGNGNPAGCLGEACIMSFVLGNNITPPSAEFPLGGSGNGSSGIIVDNISTATGASQIYFENLESGDATQVSQSGLN